MAQQLHATPSAPCRWFECLGNPRPNRDDPTAAPTWGLRMVLDPSNPEHMAWLQEMEDLVTELLKGKRKSGYAFPWAESEDKSEVLLRFKLNQFKRRDGTVSAGPTVIDSRKNPWPVTTEVGNGSVVRVGFSTYQWDAKTGSGVTFQPAVIQVLEHVPFERMDPMAVFDVVEGGAVAPGAQETF